MINLSKIQISVQTSIKNLEGLIFDLLSYFYIKIYLVILFLLNISIWALSFFIDSRIEGQQIALHYNVDFGIDFYGDKNNIYIIPVLGLLIIIINFCLIASVSRSRDRRFISHVLMITSMVTNIILLTAVISVYLINFW